MIIDGHAHACGLFLKAENIIDTLDKAGIEKVILVPGELESSKDYYLPDLARLFPSKNVLKLTNLLTKFVMNLTGKVKQIPKGNEYVYNLTRENNDRIIQFIWITQDIDKPLDYLNEKLIEWKFKGVKLHQCWESFSIDSNFFKSVAKWCEENNLPLFIHMYCERDVSQLINYKTKHPKLKLIVAHLFGLEQFIKQDYKDNNLYFDTSPIQLISTKRLMDAISFFGAEKITLGTDTPYGIGGHYKSMQRINNLKISTSEKELILGENMRKLLKL